VRLGFVASFISEPVIRGFIVGLALSGSLAAVLLGIGAVAALDLKVDIVGHIDEARARRRARHSLCRLAHRG
jgi:hypothetical protein